MSWKVGGGYCYPEGQFKYDYQMVDRGQNVIWSRIKTKDGINTRDSLYRTAAAVGVSCVWSVIRADFGVLYMYFPARRLRRQAN